MSTESYDFSSLKGPETADTLLAVIDKTNDKSLRLVLDLLVAYETQLYNGMLLMMSNVITYNSMFRLYTYSNYGQS